MTEKYNAIVLSGGGVKGITEIGALHNEFEKATMTLESIEIYAGTSVGSAICLLMIVGYTPMQIFQEVSLTRSFGQQQASLRELIRNFGLMDLDRVLVILRKMLDKKFNLIPTMAELFFISNKYFVVPVTNVSTLKVEYLDHHNSPNVSCYDVVKMSCALPIIFPFVSHNGHRYVDGGVLDNFPLDRIYRSDLRIFGVVVVNSDVPIINFETETFLSKAVDFLSYIMRLVILVMTSATLLRCKNYPNLTLVKIDSEGIPLLDFNMSADQKMSLFVKGFKCAEQVYEAKQWNLQFESV